jgi:predicted Zn finger-like uncharacterized protein
VKSGPAPPLAKSPKDPEMNVTCPNCATIYRVDPAKVPQGGVRARCNVCSAVFAVRREGEPEAGRVVPKEPAVTTSPRREVPAAPSKLEVPVAQRAEPSREPAPRPEPPRVPGPGPSSRPAAPAATAPPRPAAPQRPVSPAFPAVASPASTPKAPGAGGLGAARPAGTITPVAPATPAAPVRAPVAPQAPAAPPKPATPASVSPAASTRSAPPPTGGRPANPFLSQDPALKARRLARALISDMVVYHPGKRQEGLRDGNLKELFEEEIKKSWEEYAEQVGREVADSTPYFKEALNEILAGGRQLF